MAADHPHGLLLAAGAGRRMGTPKGLLRMPDGTPWVHRAASALLIGGCERVTVVVGAEAERVRALVGELPHTTTTYAADWATGMAASLATGLEALPRGVTAAVVLLVDLPDVSAEVVARVIAAGGAGPAALARAAYDHRPGHPVVIGRDHWAAVIEEAGGDTGAKGYLARKETLLVECGDLATGRDVDRPDAQGPTSSV